VSLFLLNELENVEAPDCPVREEAVHRVVFIIEKLEREG
jgi:hypothetical protein